MANRGRLHFSNWVREGMAAGLPVSSGSINQQDRHAAFPVQLSVNIDDNGSSRSAPVTVNLRMFGPGDVQGLDQRQVVRMEPRPGTGNFEPNYLATIEFDRADLPWMFTPMGATPERGLVPWLNLVVVVADGASIAPSRDQSLPVLSIDEPAGQLPDLSDAKYWAHAQLTLGANEAVPGNASQLASSLSDNPDAAVSRLICPRRLSPNTSYIAALVPTFASGVRAGMGLSDDEGSTLSFAWNNNPPNNLKLPVYHSWEFATGRAGDFETLVDMLKPLVAPPDMGTRPMEIGKPGYSLNVSKPKELAFESALTSLSFARMRWRETDRKSLLQEVLNTPAVSQEPVVAPPIYGQWHALRFQVNRSVIPQGWLNELNLDPRHRGAAGLGAETIRRNQEVLMHEAWKQVGQIEEANRLLQNAQAAREINGSLYRRSIVPLAPAMAIQITRPMHARMRFSTRTFENHIKQSRVPGGALDRTLRRMVSTRGVVARRALRAKDLESSTLPQKYLSDLSEGRLQIGGALDVKGIDNIVSLAATVIERNEVKESTRVYLERELSKGLRSFRPEVIKKLKPKKPIRMVPASQSLEELKTQSDPEDQEGRLFRGAAVDTLLRLFALDDGEDGKLPLKLNLVEVSKTLIDRILPEFTVVERIKTRIKIPPARWNHDDPIQPILAAPEFVGGMSQALQGLSEDFLLGRVRELRPNSMTLLENNAEFIESYLVGLNHEMARELLWRGFPTDQRGTYFPYFWRSAPVEASLDEREPFRDIPPLHTWRSSSRLGSHMHFGDGNLVLLIRGELLRRYPRTQVSAVKAEWTTGDSNGNQIAEVLRNGGEVLNGKFRRPIAEGKPGHEQRFPRFFSQMPPDISLFGFELSEDQARGDILSDGQPDSGGEAGWFFMLKEPPSGTRFGFDESAVSVQGLPDSVDDLDWQHVVPNGNPGPLVLSHSSININHEFDDAESGADLDALFWGRSSSHMAAISMQKPVLVAIHADDMLPKEGT